MEHLAEQHSFEQLATELSPILLRYFRRYVGDPTVAEDLLQETLIRMARGLSDFAGRASVKTWAFSIATRVAADYFRKPERRLYIVDVNEAAELADTDLAIDERIVVDEMNACIRQVIDSLPEDYRTALVLHDLEDPSAQQIAEICTCSLATTKIRIHRARNRLKTALQQKCEFYRDDDTCLDAIASQNERANAGRKVADSLHKFAVVRVRKEMCTNVAFSSLKKLPLSY